jgi:hypothetical protein
MAMTSGAGSGASSAGLPQNLPPEIAEKYEGIQKIQLEVRQLVNRHQQFESQLNENSMVKEVGCYCCC